MQMSPDSCLLTRVWSLGLGPRSGSFNKRASVNSPLTSMMTVVLNDHTGTEVSTNKATKRPGVANSRWYLFPLLSKVS